MQVSKLAFCKYPISVLQWIQNSIKDYTCNIYINLWSLDRSDNRSDQSIKLQNANHEGLSSLLRYYRTTWVRDTAYLPRLKVFVVVILAMGDTYHPSYLYHKTTPKLVLKLQIVTMKANSSSLLRYYVNIRVRDMPYLPPFNVIIADILSVNDIYHLL